MCSPNTGKYLRGYRFTFNGKESDSEWNNASGSIYDYGFRIYNPRIGKFLSVDPLMKNYCAWTPYAFAMNRLIDGIDLDGLEWAKAEDANGNVKYTITFKVKNSANISNEVKEHYLTAIASGIESTFKTESNGLNRITTVVFDKESTVEDGDFYIDLVNEIEYDDSDESTRLLDAGKVDNIGDTQSNRVQILVHEGMTDLFIKHTASHESGHTAGLYHPDKYLKVDSYKNSVDADNLMWQGAKGFSLTDSQWNTIDNTISNGFTEPPFRTNHMPSKKPQPIPIKIKEPKLEKRLDLKTN